MIITSCNHGVHLLDRLSFAQLKSKQKIEREKMTPGGIMRLSDFSQNNVYDFERFATQPAAAQEHVLAMSTHSHLLLTHVGGVLDMPSTASPMDNSSSGAPTGNNTFEQPVISRVAIEYKDKHEEDRINTIAWITTQVIACGFESGLVQGYGENGDRLFQFIGPKDTCVSAIKTTIEGPSEEILWILFENGILLAVPLSQALENNFMEAFIFSMSKYIQQANDFILTNYVETAAQSFAMFDPLQQSSQQAPETTLPFQSSTQRSKSTSNNNNNNVNSQESMNAGMTWSSTLKRLIVIGGQATMSLFHLDYYSILTQERKRWKQEAKSSSASSLSAVTLTKSFFSMVSSFTAASSQTSTSSSSSFYGTDEETVDPSITNNFTYFFPSNASSSSGSNASKRRQFRELTRVTALLTDDKRRMIRLSVDPLGALCACADGLGRVILYDLLHAYQGHAHHSMISSSTQVLSPDDNMSQQPVLLPLRLWKGVRDAHFGWIIEEDNQSLPKDSNSRNKTSKHTVASSAYYQTHSSTNHNHQHQNDPNQTIQLRLAIFAPQLGLVSIYQMRNGPCVRVIPVGFNVKMLRVPHPIFQESRNALETVLVLRSDSHTHSIEVVSLASTSQSETQLAMLVDLIMDDDKHKLTTNHTKDIVSPRRQHLFPPEIWFLPDDLQDVYGLISPSSYDNKTTNNEDNDEYFHGDIQSSIQEAWKGLQQQFQQHTNSNIKQTKPSISVPEIALPWQLSRLLRMFYVHCFHQNNYNYPQATENPNVVSYTSKLETEIVKLFSVVTSVSLYLTLLRILDVVETLQFIMYHIYVPNVHYIFDPAVNMQIYEEKNMKDIEENLCLLLNPMYMRQHHMHLSISNSHSDDKNSFVYAVPSLWHHHKNVVLKFSIDFQRNLLQGLETLLSKITSESLSNENKALLVREITDRRQLLDAYQSLSTLRRQMTSENCFASNINNNNTNAMLLPSTIQEEAAVICRQQTPRAEALCWTMRAYKLSTIQQQDTLSNNNNNNNSNAAMNTAARSVSVSPLLPHLQFIHHSHQTSSTSSMVTHNRPVSSVSPPPGNLLLSPVSPTRANNTANSQNTANASLMDGSNRYKHRMLVLRETMQLQQLRRTNSNASMSPNLPSPNLTSPINRHVSNIDNNAGNNNANINSENTGYAVEQEDPVNVPFALFLQFFAYVETATSHERRLLTYLLAPFYQNTTNTTNYSKRRVKELCFLGASLSSDMISGSNFFLDIDQWTRQRLRLLLCLPLLSDMTSLHTLTSILKKLDIRFTGPLSLLLLLPMCLQVVKELTPSVLVADLLVKKNNTSPLQRWLRDHLLMFQVAMTEYRANKYDISSAVSASVSELDKEPFSGLECTDILSVCHRLTGKLQPNATNANHGIISFGEYVLHLFAPVLYVLRHSAQLEHNMSFLSLTMETLQAVNDQIERRTYGDEHVHRVMQECETLFRQMRVLLLLKSRVVHGYPTLTEMQDDNIAWDNSATSNTNSSDTDNGSEMNEEEEYLDWNLSAAQYAASSFTIYHLDTAHVSISRILAQDSLEFGYRVTQSIEHEERCRDVFLHTIIQQHQQELQQQQLQQHQQQPRLSDEFQGNTNNSNTTHSTSEALLAWGKSADKRWRDLLSLALTEDAIYAAHSTNTNGGSNTNAASANDSSAPLKNTTSTSSPLPTIHTTSNHHNTPSTSNTASTSISNTTSNNNTHLKRKRKPLLLYFPYHNHPILLGSFRALWTAAQWAQHPQKIDLLVVVCEHLFEIEKPWRGLVAYEIYMRYLFPVYQGLICLEEENTGILRPNTSSNSNSNLVISPGRKSPMDMNNSYHNHSSQIYNIGRTNSSHHSDTFVNDGLLRVEPMRAQQLMLLMKDPALVKSLVTLTVEMLTYILESFSQLSSASDGGASLTQLPLSETARTLLSLAESNNPLINNNTIDNNSNNNGTILSAIISNWQNCWPPVKDFTLDHLPKRFLSLLLPLHCRDVVHYHICVAYTLCLRFQCALRGVSPSLLLGRRLSITQYEKVKRLATSQTNTNKIEDSDDYVDDEDSGYVELLHEVWLSTAPTSKHTLALQSHVIRHYLLHNDTSHVLPATIQARGQFLLLSFRRMMLLLHHPPNNSGSGSTQQHPSVIEVRPQILYHLGKLWGFPLDVIRLLHVQALLEQGESVQNEVENMVLSQFDDVNVVMDALLSFARQQLGSLLCTVESLPQYGPVLAAMDAEALLWAKQAVSSNNTTKSTNILKNNSDKEAMDPHINNNTKNATKDTSPNKKVHHLLSLSNMSQLQGGFKQQLNKSFSSNNNNTNKHSTNDSTNTINSNVHRTAVDIAVIRRVVLYLQTLLLNVPLKDRNNNTTGNSDNKVLPVYAHWAEKYLPHNLTNSINNGTISGTNNSSYASILHMTVYHTWLERKARCDALLSLCNAIVTATVRLQQQINNSNHCNNNNSKMLKQSGFK